MDTRVGLMALAYLAVATHFGGCRTPEPKYVYTRTALAPGFDMGVNTSGGETSWVNNASGYVECNYPAGQDWGAVFITVGKPTATVSARQTIDVSQCDKLVVEMRGGTGGEAVAIGLKAAADPDNGLEPKYVPIGLTTKWKTYRIPLRSFIRNPYYPSGRFGRIYVAFEVVFEGDSERTVCFRQARFE